MYDKLSDKARNLLAQLFGDDIISNKTSNFRLDATRITDRYTVKILEGKRT